MRERTSKEDPAIRAMIQDALAQGPADDSKHPSDVILAAFADGLLVEPDRSRVERHLAACGSCAEVLLLASRAASKPSSPRTGPRLWRMAASWLLVAGGVAAALAVGRMTATRVESLAMGRLDQMLGGGVSAEAVRLTFEDGPALKISDLRVVLHEGTAPTVSAREATLRPVFSSLAAGDFRASLALDEATITIVEIAPGRYSIDPFLPGARPPKALRDAAWHHGVAAVYLEDATIRYMGAVKSRNFVLSGVDAQIDSIKGPGPVQVSISGSSSLAEAPFRMQGEVSFAEGEPPSYVFPRFAIGGVPLRLLGTAADVVRGRLNFEGKISATGRDFHSLMDSLSGAGRAEVGPGALPGFPLVKNLMASLGPESQRNRQEPDVALAKKSNTRFQKLTADLRLKDGILDGRNIRVQAEGFELSGEGQLAPHRKLRVGGEVRLDRSSSKYFSTIIPRTKAWLRASGEMEVPFLATGILPEIEIQANQKALPAARVPGQAPPAFLPAGDGLPKAARAASRGFGTGKAMPPALRALSTYLVAGGSAEPQEVQKALGVSRKTEVLLTGYYEPIIEGRRNPSKRFRYPIYGPPADAAKRAKSRREIEQGALRGEGLELFWTDNQVELFFLQIQGSGRLRLADGTRIRLGYAAHNEHDYRSIGRVLVARGDLTLAAATAPGIRNWLAENPGKVAETLLTNPRYIYFQERGLDPSVGPRGSLGVPLVPWHSVAVDPTHHAPGSVGRLRGMLPDGRSLDTIVIAMDAGAAIEGPTRMDLFLGTGPGIGNLAGRMRSSAAVEWLGRSE